MSSVRWIVSAEDSGYMFWQCALFAHSARTRCDEKPTILVHHREHGPGHEWRSLRRDADVYFVKSYRKPLVGRDYPPRNFPGTLLEASQLFREDWFILFDPDMVFVETPSFELRWSADKVGYGPEGARVGVPYVIERRRAKELAREWLDVLDSALEWQWELVMWAYVVAMRRLGIGYSETEICDSNHDPVSRPPRAGASILHYCYNSDQWSKRMYLGDPMEVFRNIPLSMGLSLNDKIFQQLRELKEKAYA